MAVEKAPERSDAEARAALGQKLAKLVERDVLASLHRLQDEDPVRFDPLRAPVASLRLGRRRSPNDPCLPASFPADSLNPTRAFLGIPLRFIQVGKCSKYSN